MTVPAFQMPPYMRGGSPVQKRKVFISYHHAGDQDYCDLLRTNMADSLNIFTDRSLNEPVRSDDPEYIDRRIREDYICGSSVTIVLCGKDTHKRKYVDWEIRSTLHHEHALLGVALPTASKDKNQRVIVPDRLHHNIQSDYAHFIMWDQHIIAKPPAFQYALEIAIQKSSRKQLIQNNQEKMARNVT